MSRDVLQSMRAYETRKAVKRAHAVKLAASATLICAIAIGGAGLWNKGRFSPDKSLLPVSNPDSAADTTEHSDILQQPQQSTTTTASTTATQQTDNTFTQQTTTVTQATAVDSTTAVQSTDITNSGSNGVIQLCSRLEVNGVTYTDSDTPNPSAYTRDICIGKVGDFRGQYADDFHYRIAPDDSVYTVKETADVLFVVKADDSIVVMCSPAWSLAKYEPERLSPDYIDSAADADTLEVCNDFCQILFAIEKDGTVIYADPACNPDLFETILCDMRNN